MVPVVALASAADETERRWTRLNERRPGREARTPVHPPHGVQRLLRLVLPLLERPRLDELRFDSEEVLELIERPLLAPILLPLLPAFFVGILNLRQIPASPR